jgi:hypothetical protein
VCSSSSFRMQYQPPMKWKLSEGGRMLVFALELAVDFAPGLAYVVHRPSRLRQPSIQPYLGCLGMYMYHRVVVFKI